MRRIGSKAVLLLMLAATVSGLWAAKKHDGKKAAEPYGVLAGTVFREPGFALPGAEVTVEPDPQPGQTPVKIHKPKAISDGRGEFAFRVPVTAMRYAVKARAKGFSPQQKSVDMEGEQRVDVTLTLAAESK